MRIRYTVRYVRVRIPVWLYSRIRSLARDEWAPPLTSPVAEVISGTPTQFHVHSEQLDAADPIDLRPLRKEEGYPGEGSREREEEELEEREDEFRMKKKEEEKKN